MRLIDADAIRIPDDAPYKASVKRVIALQPTVELTGGDLISRSALIEELKKRKKHMIPEKDGRHVVSIEKIIEFIGGQSTVEAEPVVHGEWISLEPEIGLFECSLCGHKILRAECNYCPNCGAKMDGGVSE